MQAQAQTYPLSDQAFISFLADNYPSLLDPQQDLIISNAETFAGTLQMSNQGITNLDGLQHFKSINSVYLSGNTLVYLPSFDSLKAVVTLHMNNCGLTVLPTMDGMVVLNEIEVYENKLTSLSALESLPKLTRVIAFNNQVTDFPIFTNPSQITYMHLGGNPFNALPDFSSFVNLEGLILWALNLSTTPDLSSLTALKELNLGSNSLTVSPDLTTLTNLESLFLDNNSLQAIPAGIKNLPNLTTVNFRHNLFSLDDLKELASIPDYASIFTLMPQQAFPLQPNYEKYTGNNITLSTNYDSSVVGVSYTLLKDNVVLAENTHGTFEFQNIQLDVDGVYNIRVQTSLLPNVSIISRPIDVNVIPCIDVSKIDIKVNRPNCVEKGRITVEHTNNNSVIYKLNDNLTNETGVFTDVQPGEYRLNLATSTCNIDYPSIIYVEQLACKDFLLSPNEGLKTVTLDFNGEIRVYNKQGTLLGTVQGPLMWDGTLDGVLLPVGYYFLDINDGKNYVMVSIIY